MERIVCKRIGDWWCGVKGADAFGLFSMNKLKKKERKKKEKKKKKKKTRVKRERERERAHTCVLGMPAAALCHPHLTFLELPLVSLCFLHPLHVSSSLSFFLSFFFYHFNHTFFFFFYLILFPFFNTYKSSCCVGFIVAQTL